ncbi:MAG: hypothetical protein V2J55_13220 [Candidatus Competibacteraceae bacterium]|jgi:hypothetical protein|nr:hypothetical protein [Candidatus Competibacteraceae bacterium]
MNARVIDIFNPDGSVSQYRPLSHRLPEFLVQYGPEQGYRIVIDVQDSWLLYAGRRALYEQAIAHGHKPEAVGLPAVASSVELVFHARLLNREDQVVASAAALKPIVQYKDFEAGETAARQRLLAALGFGGEVLDDDEHQDQTAQGLTTRPLVEYEKTAVLPLAEADVAPSNSAEVKQDLGERLQHPDMPNPAPQPVASVGGSDVPAALVQQIAHLARMKGMEPPAYQTRKEAKAVLKQLIQG